MSKRKNGKEVINVPQPKYPEISVFEGNVMHCITPRDTGRGSVEYDISKLPVDVAAKAEACIAQGLARLPVLERDAAAVVKAPTGLPIRTRDK